jgi:hypothetical protein
MPTTTLTLKRPEKPGGIERLTVTYNGNVQVAGTKDRVLPKRKFLFEMDDDERALRLAELGAYHAG